MERFILKNRKRIITALVCLTISALVLGSMAGVSFNFNRLVGTAEAQTATSTVTVTAVVEAWLDFEISTTSLDITPALVQADGTMNIGSTSDLDIELGTNHPDGWEIEIRGVNNGLLSSSRTHTIDSVISSSTVATGTEAYGANATNTMAGVTVGSLYAYYGTNDVGEIRTTDRSLVSKTSSNAKESVAYMQVKATAAVTTPPASDYSDVITLTATVSP